jgi:hypothetical protein
LGEWGGEILSHDENAIEHIADLLQEVGYDEVSTGYYDLAEDERSGEVDKYTGYYYVSAQQNKITLS